MNTYRFLVWDDAIGVFKPQHPIDFNEVGDVIGGVTFKDAKKQLIEILRTKLKLVKEENEEDYLKRLGYIS